MRASLAIPGVFTPILAKGDVLVDGGVMNNFPIDIMRDKIGGGTVIGSSADPRQERPKNYDFGDSLSGWRLLLSHLAPRKKKPRMPSIVETLVNAATLNSTYMISTMSRTADVTITCPTETYGILQFDRYDEITELGYREAKADLMAWQQEKLQPSTPNPKVFTTTDLGSSQEVFQETMLKRDRA